MKQAFGSDVLDAASRLLVPFMLLFAIYVVVHGHDSPGGGFQGGVILAAAVILMRLTRGRTRRWGPDSGTALTLAAVGPLIYAGIGVATLVCGGNYLDYGVLPLPYETPVVRALGILGIEIGVTFGVMGVLILIFDALTAWTEEDS